MTYFPMKPEGGGGEGAVFTICRSLGEIRPDLNKQYAAGAARTRYVGQPASGQGDPWHSVRTTCISQIFVSFYLVSTPGNTCDVETVEQMIFP